MTRLISDEQIRETLSMRQCVTSVEEAFAASGREEFDVSERKVVAVEDGARLLSLSAASSELGRLVAHVYSGAPTGQDKQHTTVNKRQKIYLVFDAATGACEAVIGGAYLSWLKTGAMGAVAIKYLASPTAHSLAILGSGRQARAALAGAIEVRDFTDIRIWSRNTKNAKKMVDEFADLAGIATSPTARHAVEGAEVVITVTTAAKPLVAGEWLADGCHVNSVGAHYPNNRELDGQAVGRSTVFVDSYVAARAEKGELLLAEKEGKFTFDEVVGELGQVVVGKVNWTRSNGENTLFASCGSAIESLGAALGVLKAVPAAECQQFDF